LLGGKLDEICRADFIALGNRLKCLLGGDQSFLA
jgi:hypothetical protein